MLHRQTGGTAGGENKAEGDEDEQVSEEGAQLQSKQKFGDRGVH